MTAKWHCFEIDDHVSTHPTLPMIWDTAKVLGRMQFQVASAINWS